MGAELNIGKLFDKLDQQDVDDLEGETKKKNQEKDQLMVDSLAQITKMTRKIVNSLTTVKLNEFTKVEMLPEYITGAQSARAAIISE